MITMKKVAMTEKSKYEHLLDEIVQRRKQTEIVNVEEERVKIVVFSLAGESYAFHGSYVKEIIRYEKISFVPGSPDAILGVINLRGDVESVLSLHRTIGLPDSDLGPRSRIIIAESDGIRSGVLADSVEDVMDVPADSILPAAQASGSSGSPFIVGFTGRDGKNVTLLDAGRVLGSLLPRLPLHQE